MAQLQAEPRAQAEASVEEDQFGPMLVGRLEVGHFGVLESRVLSVVGV
jgi:hypothetical protein